MYAEGTPKTTIQRPAPENIIKCRGFLAPYELLQRKMWKKYPKGKEEDQGSPITEFGC